MLVPSIRIIAAVSLISGTINFCADGGLKVLSPIIPTSVAFNFSGAQGLVASLTQRPRSPRSLDLAPRTLVRLHISRDHRDRARTQSDATAALTAGVRSQPLTIALPAAPALVVDTGQLPTRTGQPEAKHEQPVITKIASGKDCYSSKQVIMFSIFYPGKSPEALGAATATCLVGLQEAVNGLVGNPESRKLTFSTKLKKIKDPTGPDVDIFAGKPASTRLYQLIEQHGKEVDFTKLIRLYAAPAPDGSRSAI